MDSALIIGGGVAGPVTAMALRRAGLEATVYEAHPRGAEDLGAFLTLQANGVAALRAIDAHEAVADLGFPTPSMRFVSWTGRRLGVMANGGVLPDGTTSQTMRRSDLYAALREEAIRRGVRIEYGKRLVDARQTDGNVTAVFADGAEVEGDVLIGCDGIRSVVRRVIDPDVPPARYVPLLNLGGYAHGVSTRAAPGEYTMVYGKRAFFGYVRAPDGETWWFANPQCAQDPGPSLATVTDAQWRERLHDLFVVDRSPAVDLIRATPGTLRGWSTFDIPTIPRWHRGRMVLAGDAAHATSPSSGQGASMAIEDAVILAKCLRDLPTPQEAFSAFEGVRRERVECVVAAGARASGTKVAGPVGRVFRDLGMPIFIRTMAGVVERSLTWVHQYQIDWDTPVPEVAGAAIDPRHG